MVWQMEVDIANAYTMTDLRIQAVIAVMEKWFNYIEDDTAELAEVDLDDKTLMMPADKLNAMINGIDERFVIELDGRFVIELDERFVIELDWNKSHWKAEGKTHPPEFGRLGGKAKLAFAQDLMRAIKMIGDEITD